MRKLYLIMLTLSIVLSGCWDQRLLKESSLVLVAGIDQSEDSKLNISFAIQSKGEKVTVFETQGNTLRDSSRNTSRKVYGTFDTSQNRLILVGEKAAREGIYSYLEVLYHDPKSALNAKIAVVKGEAKQAFEILKKKPTIKIEEVDTQILGAEIVTTTPEVDIQSIFPIMLNPKEDMLMPYFEVKNKELIIAGSALFNGDKYTGKLNPDDTTLLLLMQGEIKKTAALNVRFRNKEDHESFLTLNVLKAKPHISIEFNGQKPNINLSLNLTCEIIEYPVIEKLDRSNMFKLNKIISESLTNQMISVTKKIQKANCDALGIGLLINSKNPSYFNNIQWNDKYKNINFTSKVIVEIEKHGIIN